MVVTEAIYLTDNEDNNVGIFCKIDDIETNVPMDEGNSHYQEILKQVKAGTLTIKDAE